MTAVLNVVIPVLIGITIGAMLYFAWRTFDSRTSAMREAYGVGKQEARQEMQVNLMRSGLFLLLSLILLGVFGLSPKPTDMLPAERSETPTRPTTLLTTAAPTTTATPVRVLEEPTATVESSPTSLPPTNTATPEPTETPTPEPATATVNSGVGVWLRSAPSTEAEQLEWILDGTVLTLLPGRETAEDFEWQQVRTSAGNEGWVATDFIVYNQP